MTSIGIFRSGRNHLIVRKCHVIMKCHDLHIMVIGVILVHPQLKHRKTISWQKWDDFVTKNHSFNLRENLTCFGQWDVFERIDRYGVDFNRNSNINRRRLAGSGSSFLLSAKSLTGWWSTGRKKHHNLLPNFQHSFQWKHGCKHQLWSVAKNVWNHSILVATRLLFSTFNRRSTKSVRVD